MTTKDYISESVKVHGDKYDYSLVKYINAMTVFNIFNQLIFSEAKSHLKKTKINDKIKDDFCINENINLLRISYKDDINIKLKLI